MTAIVRDPTAVDLAPPAEARAASRDPVLVYLMSLDSEHSRRAMLGGLRRALRAAGASGADPLRYPWAKLDRGLLTAMRAALVRDYGPACVSQSLAAVRGVLREAHEMGQISGDEWSRLRGVRGARAQRGLAGRDVPEDELAKLFAACDRSDPVGVRDAALLAVLRVTGARRHEVAGADLGDLDVARGTLRVVGKRDKERTCHLGDAVVDLEAWLDVRGGEPGPLFLPWSHKREEFLPRRLTPSGVYCALKKVAKRAGVQMSPHDLRRTATGDLLDADVDLATVQKILGHEDPKTTARYDRRPARTQAAAAAKLKVPR